MSLKTSFATVLKTLRISRGLTHKKMAEASSRGYILKLEHGRSSPTVDKLTAISDAMGLSPLTLFTLTLSMESGQPIDSLVQRLKDDVADLASNGVFKELEIPPLPAIRPPRAAPSRQRKVACPSPQVELCFAE